MRLTPALALLIYFGCQIARASAQMNEQIGVTANPPGGNVEVFNPVSMPQFWVCVLCAVISLIVFSGQFFLLYRSGPLAPDDVVKNITITLVIISAVILIVAGYSSQQTAQAFGLFGTIVGYLLGRSHGRQDKKE